MDILNIVNLSLWQFVLIVAAAFFVGIAKTGIGAFSMMVIPILASVFGGKDAMGIMLTMLIIGDIFAVWYYNRHADWKNIRKLLIWTLIGLAAGAWIGNLISDRGFKLLIGIFVLLCLGIMIYMEKRGDAFKVPERTWLYVLTGVACGVASMIGNAAGPIFTIYLLAMGFKKENFMGTTAWFFLIVNVLKVPIQVLVWKNITFETFILSLLLIPAITVGALLGKYIIRRINEKIFRHLVFVMTAIIALRLFL